MTGNITRFSKSILEQPQLITQARFEEIAEVLENPDRGLHKAAMDAQLAHDKASKERSKEDLVETTVGVLRIEGALTNKPTMFGALCGLTSYQELLQQTQDLCDNDSVNTIMMLVDSGGGEAYNLFSAARSIRDKCTNANKKLIAFIDGSSASAAYGLTCVADEVIIHPDAMAGSIGVVVRLVNTNKAMKEAGVETTYITAGDSKVPFDKDGDFREDFLEDIQDRVTELYDNFIDHVATMRDISPETVRNTEAKMFSADKALELGLVDKVMEGEEFYTYLAELSVHGDEDDKDKKSLSKVNTIKLESKENKQELQTTMSTEDKLMSDENKTPEMSVDAEMVAKLQATMEQQATQLAAYQAKEVEAEKTALSSSLDKFEFLADNKEQVVSFLSDASVSQDHKSLLNTVLTSAQASNEAIKEEAADNISEAQLAAEQAVKDKEAIKEEFSTKEHASTALPEKELNVTETLKEKVALKKAAKLAAKNA